MTSPQARSSYTRHNLIGPSAIVVGNEHAGVTGDWLTRGVPVRIDMVGPMNSLSASVAAAVLLFEAVRQRTRSDVRPSGLLRAFA